MYFDEERFLNPDVLHVVRRELYAINSSLDVPPYGLKYVPTHTEDGIPIRKLYVSNLPPKTTRTELFGVFAQYGFIKSCWLRMGDKGPNRTPTPTYAFVTYSNPADAHKALQAPSHEKSLRGRHLRISPADSWHQPAEDADGRVRWKPRGARLADDSNTEHIDEAVVEDLAQTPEPEEMSEPTTSTEETTNEEENVSDVGEPSYTILDVLNTHCLTHILDYVPIGDLIRSERVSKTWQAMIREYLQGVRTLKTSRWQHVSVMLTTAVLRRVLQRVGAALLRLHIDHRWSALNDRTAHIVGKFCPNLEELKVVGMHTKNWNPLIYGCKQLKHLSFESCNKLTDASLVSLVKSESCLESLSIANNTHITGLFLTGTNPPQFNSLSFYNCYSLQGTVLSAAIENFTGLTTLRLDVCPVTLWKIVPLILSKLPKLQELSLSEHTTVEMCFSQQSHDEFCEAISVLTELKILNLSRNIYITNTVLKKVAQSCQKLESLNVSSCNSGRSFPHPGVGDEGIGAVCRGCRALRRLDVSYLGALTEAGVRAAAGLPRLARLRARGLRPLSAAPLAACLAACSALQELDVCGCDGVSEEVVSAAVRALDAAPRALTLWLAGTAAAADARENQQELPSHKLLTVDVEQDRCNPHLRPDYVEAGARVFDGSSEGSLEDLYDNEDFDDFFGPDDELFLDEDDLEDYEGVFHFGLHPPDILLL